MSYFEFEFAHFFFSLAVALVTISMHTPQLLRVVQFSVDVANLQLWKQIIIRFLLIIRSMSVYIHSRAAGCDTSCR